MRKVDISIALLGALIHAPVLAADKERRVYTPAGPWAMEYADDACRLVRNFTDGKNQVTLAFERFEIGPAMRLGLSGSSLQGWSGASKAKFRYRPQNELRESNLQRTQLADGREAFLISSASLIPREKGRLIVEKWQGVESLEELSREEDAAAADITAILISEGFKDEPELRFGPLTEPIRAMRACATDLVKSWNVDPLAVASMSRFPEPLNQPASWLKDADYPANMRRARQGGLFALRLIISPEGKVEDCHFEVETPGDFEAVACKAVRARALFVPALDARGQPMRTYWRQHVRFIP